MKKFSEIIVDMGKGLHPKLAVQSFSHNSGAIRLYERSGFTQIGVIPHFTYSQGKWRDDIRMEKIILTNLG